MTSILFKKIIFFALIALCLTPLIDAPVALVLGFAMVNTIGHPFQSASNNAVKWLLKAAIVGLGFGMNFQSAVRAGIDGLVVTIVTISLVLALGWLLGRLLKLHPKTSYLVSCGTAICGGSAIAAVAPIIDAEPKQISVALGTVFILNAIALLAFPFIGHFFEMTQYQFGLWSAIAIHDTSSVVGAASAYGAEALETATTIKLGRALWIIPISLLTVFVTRKSRNTVNIPYFIGLFILAMAVSTYVPELQPVYSMFVILAKKALVVTLFLVGSGLSLDAIKATGIKTLLQGVVLWLIVSVLSFIAIVSLY